jgi:hypothetical protein
MSSSVEILGQWINLPDPDSVASLAAHYDGVCTTIAEAKSQLRAIGSAQDRAEWKGLAAGKFATLLGRVPAELEQAWQSCSTVARALASYSSGLRPVVAALRSLAYQAEEAQGTVRATQAAREQASRTGQVSAILGWDVRLAEAEAAVGVLELRLSRQLGELHQLSGDCVRQIRQAEPQSVHRDLLSDLGRDAVDAGLAVAGDIFVAPFTHLYHDVYDDALTMQWDWARYSNVLEDISGVLAVVALVVAPIPGLDFVDAVLVPASVAFSVAGTVAEGVALVTREKDASLSDFAFDVAGLGLAGGGRLIRQGLKTAQLAHGPEAHAAAKAIWRTGKRNFFKLSDSKPSTVHNPLDTIKDDLDRDLHLGVKPSTVAWKHPFESAEWGMDKVGNELDILQAEIDKNKPELDQKSGGS